MNWNETDERPSWPDELEEPVAKLGPPTDVYTTSRRKAFNKFLLGIALLVGGIGVNYVYFWVLGFFFFPDKFLMLLLFGPLIAGVGLLINSFRDRGMWVLVYPTGLLRWHKNEVLSFPWDEIVKINLHRLNQCEELHVDYNDRNEIVSVVLGLEGAGSRFFGSHVEVQREDGTSAYFPSSLEDYPELGERIQSETFARLWPKLWRDFSEGKTIEFGDIEIDRSGLTKDQDRLPWNAFGGAKVVNGRLVISRLGRWRAWHEEAIQGVDNPHLLMAMLRAGQPTLTTQLKVEEVIGDQ
jgi:hypothetical protein